jgi:hypothetical protein
VSSSVFGESDFGSGHTTSGTVVSPFSYSNAWTVTLVLNVTGPPPHTVTVESFATSSSSGTNPAVDVTELETAGEVVSEVVSGAAEAGGYEKLSAVHDGTSPPPWDTEQGLGSAVSGQDIHPLSYTGAAIQPMISGDGSRMLLAETGDASRGPSDETNWVSHPSAIGYRRAGVYAASSSGSHVTIAEVAPGFDSGMNDGTSGEELTRITNFYTGAKENPTAAQSAPTPRAEQDISNGVPSGNPIAVPIPERGTGGGPGSPPPLDTSPPSPVNNPGIVPIDDPTDTPPQSNPAQIPPKAAPNDAGPPSMWNLDEWFWFLGNRQKYQRPDGTWGWEPINKDPSFLGNWFQDNVEDPAAAAAGIGGLVKAFRYLGGGNPAPAAPKASQKPQSGPPSAPAPDGTNTPPARFVVDRKGVITDTVAPSSGSVRGMNPNDLRFSQRSAGGSGRAAPLRESMQGGWNGPAVDAVETADGIVSIDNTRVAVARELGMEEIPVNVHLPSDPLPESMLGRFGDAKTWGEALAQRTGKQRPPLPFGGTPDTPRLPQ